MVEVGVQFAQNSLNRIEEKTTPQPNAQLVLFIFSYRRSETCYLINPFHIKVCPDHFSKSFVAVFPDISVIQYAAVLRRRHVNPLILAYIFNQPLPEFIIVKNPVNIGAPYPTSLSHRSIFYSNILAVSTGDHKERPCTIPAGSVPHMYLISFYIHTEGRKLVAA